MTATAISADNLPVHLLEVLAHLDHILPGQAPLLDFVHHNTLHGYQHLPFTEALAASEALTGISAYLPDSQNRQFYQQGRINDDDINAALAHAKHLDDAPVCTLGETTITRHALYRIALRYDLAAISLSQLHWQIAELSALTTVQADVPAAVAQQLIADSTPALAVKALWDSLLAKLELPASALNPAANTDAAPLRHSPAAINKHALNALNALLAQLGDSITLRGLVLALTGIDILDAVRPQLIRFAASAMDEGVAAWTLPERSGLGFFAAWRATVAYDANPFLHELPDWQATVCDLPEDALSTLILQLTELEIPPPQWAGYLQRLALELPGWSGLINWRQHHPQYQTANDAKPTLADYLAIRLTLDRLWLNQICHDTWKCAAKISTLHSYFAKHGAEFLVRQHLYQGLLPEHLSQQAETLDLQADPERQNRADWQHIAEQIDFDTPTPRAAALPTDVWPLFRLCQHLGLNAAALELLSRADLLAMRDVLANFTAPQRGSLWLYAFERNYRERFFHALRANHGRGRWQQRGQRPEAQLVFCMDDREEGFRRHLEEYNPAIETLGAAGFFGIAMNYRGLDDHKVTPLCPVVVTPAHEVQEIARAGGAATVSRHQRGKRINNSVAAILYHSLRRRLLLATPLLDAIAPVALLGLLAKALFPKPQQRLLAGAANTLAPKVNTQLHFSNTDTLTPATTTQPKLGFTDTEQADRIAGFLRNTGLTYSFAELVVLMGHGSISQNNPHLAAYDCGACSGRHGGPNARVFAAMANRPVIRTLLAARGIVIPEDTWFIGAEHNTCNEAISWYDVDDLPAARRPAFNKLQQALRHAQQWSAHERCRRLASAPRRPTPAQALAHIEERATDYSQARPELGHATNAAAIVGRRSLSQGAFFDRRVFLISYDPSQDADGKILEGILLAVGPVGAGINLEYYFSTVNNDRFGCGSKVPHNLTGFFGVMEGAGSDLRTGLPQQMVEIHEAMRLQLLVEAQTAVLERIYTEQPSLRELIAGAWLHLSVKDPDSGEIFVFEPDLGFVLWQAEAVELAVCADSPECYRDQTLPVAPVLVRQP